jgi:hypothetical protein
MAFEVFVLAFANCMYVNFDEAKSMKGTRQRGNIDCLRMTPLKVLHAVAFLLYEDADVVCHDDCSTGLCRPRSRKRRREGGSQSHDDASWMPLTTDGSRFVLRWRPWRCLVLTLISEHAASGSLTACSSRTPVRSCPWRSRCEPARKCREDSSSAP